jgi:hypothetical protein
MRIARSLAGFDEVDREGFERLAAVYVEASDSG